MFYKFNIDKNFQDFLKGTREICRISNILNIDEYVDYVGDFIKVEPKLGFISFIPESKIKEDHSGFNDVKFRTTIKIGRFVKKFLNKRIQESFQVSSSEIEDFVNLYKSFFNIDKTKFKIVSGDEILKWYLQENYYSPNGFQCGTIWNSCMRYSDRNKFMNLYAKNPDKVKMLVYLEDSKVRSRAILWEDVDLGGKSVKVMDRIYYFYDHDVNLFKNWASENGYITKFNQTSKSELFFNYGGGKSELFLKVKLENHMMKNYPYLDTFKYYDLDNGIFSNYERSHRNYVLVQANGSMHPERQEVEEDDDF